MPTLKNIYDMEYTTPLGSKGFDVVLDFWNLTVSQRRNIISDLNLLKENEFDLPEPERYLLAFQRAKENQSFDKLKEAIISKMID